MFVCQCYYHMMVQLACIIFGASVFMEVLKQMLSQFVMCSMIYFRNLNTQRIACLATSISVFTLFYFLAPMFKSIFFGTTECFYFFGFLWVPQIIQNTIRGTSKVPGLSYVIICSIYSLYLIASINLTSDNMFMLKTSDNKFNASMLIALMLIQIVILIA